MGKKQIDEATLMALIEAGVVREAVITRIRHQGDHKWAIQVKYGLNTQILRSKREAVRLFHTIDTAAKLLFECGMYQMSVDYS
ncbi:MAG: hypothetical protein V7731_24060 [Amphritea sp.]